MKLLSRTFWSYALERAAKTAAQSAGALIGGDYTHLLHVNYVAVASASGLAALLSVLTSLSTYQDAEPEVGAATEPAAITQPAEAQDALTPQELMPRA